MFKEKSLLFMYCITPVHMGTGQAIGVVDNPIQRETHTRHPSFAGSGIKGALRHNIAWDTNEERAIFGPKKDEDFHGGAVSFGDAQIVAFPVRSLKKAFVYATSPTALARLQRLEKVVLGEKSSLPELPAMESLGENCLVSNKELLSDGQLVLESFSFSAKESEELEAVAKWLSKKVIPNDQEFFQEKIKTDLVLLSDEAFDHFCENATSVEAHVRINEETGAAEDGGLFYTENLPPETIMVAPVFAAKPRHAHKDETQVDVNHLKDAVAVMEELTKASNSSLLQLGGDATTGRGQVLLSYCSTTKNKGTSQ